MEHSCGLLNRLHLMKIIIVIFTPKIYLYNSLYEKARDYTIEEAM